MRVTDNPERAKSGRVLERTSEDLALREPLDLGVDLEEGDTWQALQRGVGHLPVNLEWLVGLLGSLVNKPAVGGESNRLMNRVLMRGFRDGGRMR